MATQTDIIRRVRRHVADFKSPLRYEDAYYQDSIQFGLEKLSFDFGEEYATVPVVPTSKVFLLVKLAIIQMCYIRAAEGAEAESGEGDKTRWTTIAVPDLSVSDSNSGESRGPAYWTGLARDLQSEYDGEVGDSKAGQNTGGEITEAVMRRISLVHGGYAKRRLDEGLPAVSLLATLDGNDVDLSWDRIFKVDLRSYDIERSDGPNFDEDAETVERLHSVWDSVETEWTDEAVDSGIWYYRVRTVNPNEIKTDSNIVTVTVP